MDSSRGTLDQRTIRTLRDGLPLFSALTNNSSCIDQALTQYLHFYQLPLPAEDLSLAAGTTANGEIAVMAWHPANSQGTVVVVHGYMDHIGLYGHLIRDLLHRKLTVLCFDAKGHGLSAGAPCSISSFSEYIETLEDVIELAQTHFDGPLHGIGQSMGGAVLMKHLLTQSTLSSYPFTTLNLLTPLLQPWGWNQSRLLYHLSRWFVKSIKRVFRPSSWDKEFLAFLKDTDPMQPRRVPTDWVGAMDEWIKEFKQLPISQFPLHIIQGNNDKTLDWVYNLERFKHKFPSSSLSVIDTANHHLVNESEALRKEIFAALKL